MKKLLLLPLLFSMYAVAQIPKGSVTKIVPGTNVTVSPSSGVGVVTINATSGGSVSSFSAGTLPPLFTTSVATPTTTPALSFALSSAAANTIFGNPSDSSGSPSYTANPKISSLTFPAQTTSSYGLNFNGDSLLYRSSAAQLTLLQNTSSEGGLAVVNSTNAAGADAYLRACTSTGLGFCTGFYVFPASRTASGVVQPLETYISSAVGLTGGLAIGTETNAPVKLFSNNTETVRVTDVGMQLDSITGKTCSSTNRGAFNYIAGSTGVKDTVQVCAKDASDTYAWRSIY